MLDVTNWGSRTTLSSAITPTDTTILVPSPDRHLFEVATGDHVYITVRSGNTFERMVVRGSAAGRLLVDRAQDNTTAKSFPTGACVSIEWNPAQLCEYTRMCIDGTDTPCLTPQTVCMDCNTCLEVGADGRIKSINKGTGIC